MFKAINHREGPFKLVAFLLFISIPLQRSFAQAAAAPTTNSEDQIAPAVAKELETLRRRIEQLEAQLRNSKREPPDQEERTPLASADVASVTPHARVPVKAMVFSPQRTPEKVKPAEPFVFADWSWLNGNPRTKTPAFDSSFFTPEIRADVDYVADFNHPKDDTISGSSEVFRSNEVQLTQLGVGGDFHFDAVRARLMTQFGMYSQTPSGSSWPRFALRTIYFC